MAGTNIPSTSRSARFNSTAASAGARGAKPARSYPRSFWWYLKWFFISLQLLVFCAIVILVTAGYGMYQQVEKGMPDVNFIASRNKAEATRIFASDGSLLAEFKGVQRRFIPIEDLKVAKPWGSVGGNLVNATLSIEDKRFYTHPGMDIKRIAGAALANLRSHDSTSQGGSTITEQLAVNVYLTRTKTLSRRLQTAMLALQLERRFSKDEILEMYLNEIYYGNRAYGCEAAAQTYFGKSAKDLSIAEAALLAGVPNSPAYYDPFDHYDHARKRQMLVLKEMITDNPPKISWGQYQDALNDTTIEGELQQAAARMAAQRRTTQRWVAPYFVSYVKSYLQKQYGWSDDYLNKSGLKIYTTLDPQMQAAAESIMTRNLNEHSKALEGAMVCIDPWTGQVLAMYGGRDFYDDKNGGQWNRAVQGKRQCGSSFKAYVYATAMENGYHPDSIVIDKKLMIGHHEIRNDDRRHRGAITFREALGISDNVAAVTVLEQVGIGSVIQKAHLMGIESNLVPVPSLALGTSEVSVLEHTSAYGVFSTGGLRAEETPIQRVENYAGTTLVEQEQPVHGARVLSEGAAKSMWEMLRYVVQHGTGRRAQIDNVDVVGKTGTTSDNRDVWFMGATHQLVCGVWMGYDKPRELQGNSAGGAWCAPAWRSFMVKALGIWGKKDRMDKMVEDAHITDARAMATQTKKLEVRLCNESGLLALPGCPSTHVVEFTSAEDVPKEHCSIPAHMGHGQSDETLGDDAGSTPAQSQPQLGDQNTGLGLDEPARRDTPPPDDSQGFDDQTQRNSSSQIPLGADGSQPDNSDNGGDNSDQGLARHTQTSYRPPKHSGYSRVPQATSPDNDDGAPRVLNDDGGDYAVQH